MICGFLYLVLNIITWLIVARFSKQSFTLMGLLSVIRHVLWLKDFLRFMVLTLETHLALWCVLLLSDSFCPWLLLLDHVYVS